MKNLFSDSFKFANKFTGLLFLLTVAVFLSITARAQTEPSPGSNPPDTETRTYHQRFVKRPSLLESLNLTDDQKQQIRNINLETREAVRQGFERQRAARRALDAAIYADTIDQTQIDESLREFNAAQTEASKLRMTIELRIRQILIAEQLVRFRELRQAAEQKFRDRKQSMRSRRNLPRF